MAPIRRSKRSTFDDQGGKEHSQPNTFNDPRQENADALARLKFRSFAHPGEDLSRNFLFQPNLDAGSFSPVFESYDEPTQSPLEPGDPVFISPLTIAPDQQPQSSQQSQQIHQYPSRRTSSLTFLEPMTPIFPLRRQSHITLGGRRSSRSQAARRVVSHAAKKPDGHIPRPPNCFLLYRSWIRQQNKLHGKGNDASGKKNEQSMFEAFFLISFEPPFPRGSNIWG